ncbi:S-layer homology domain-containing protein [Acetivibrio sp. MSJd-27]|uniref:S-layer homology domain-containing protein n=1 Tax=Acetivibrio sp. MSJd-27 TaxID=2841523 RepID=UPI001C0F679E|nr:S-layer homology domain-containing protein [Acetivibrio sp. MSJd-27]MBU5451002.1 S-layer homology domain-containing protein [Acetivibrio sp. MSJd-27]
MRNFRRRTISILCMITLLFNIFAFVAAANDSFAEGAVNEKLEFLQSLGVLEGEENLSREITRGEFTKLIADLFFSYIDYSKDYSDHLFNDVSREHPYYREITALRSLSVISGDDFQNFYPARMIDFHQATTILVNAIGGGVYAKAKGGYPTGYLAAASEIGMLKGLSNGQNFFLKDAVTLLYNTLFANAYDITIHNDGSFSIDKNTNQTYLEKYLKIYEFDGIMTDDGYTTIDHSATVGVGRIVVKLQRSSHKVILDIGDTEILHYLGQRLVIYAKENEDATRNDIVYYRVSDKVSSRTVNARDILECAANYVEYQVSEDAVKTNKLYLSDAVDIFENGVRVTDIHSINPHIGFVLFVDNDSDGSYDFVNITKLNYDMVIDGVSASDYTVRCRQNPVNSLQFDADYKEYVRIWKNGTLIDMANIQSFDIVSVARSPYESDGHFAYNLYVSSDVVEGKIDSKETDEKKLFINGSGYRISNQLTSANERLFETLKMDELTTFRLNYQGEIAYMDKQKPEATNYCYLVTLYRDEDNFNEPMLKTYTLYGEFQDYTLSEKITVDGEVVDGRNNAGNSVELIDEVREMLCLRPDGAYHIPDAASLQAYSKCNSSIYPRPAVISVTKNGKVLKIDTDTNEYNSNDEKQLIPGKRYMRNGYYYTASLGTFDGEFFITSDTVIMQVPDVDRYDIGTGQSVTNMNAFEKDLYDINNYKLLTLSEFNAIGSGYSLDMQPYNIDEKTGVADLVVLRGSIVRTTYLLAPIYVFTRMTEYYDEKNEKTINKIYYLNGDKEEYMLLDRDNLHEYYNNIIFGGKYPIAFANSGTMNESVSNYVEVEPLKKGDIIYCISQNGYLHHIQRELNISKINEKTASSYRPSLSEIPYGTAAYNASSSGIPYDQRPYPVKGYSQTMNLELFIPLSFSNNILKIMEPYRKGTTIIGSFEDFIGNEEKKEVWERYIGINQSKLKIMVVTEKNCDIEHDNCSFEVHPGTVEDIITADSFGNYDYHKASRIYSYSVKGDYNIFVVMNLTEKHNTHTR